LREDTPLGLEVPLEQEQQAARVRAKLFSRLAPFSGRGELKRLRTHAEPNVVTRKLHNLRGRRGWEDHLLLPLDLPQHLLL